MRAVYHGSRKSLELLIIRRNMSGKSGWHLRWSFCQPVLTNDAL